MACNCTPVKTCGHGFKSRTPSEHQPIPTKIGSKLGGDPFPRWYPWFSPTALTLPGKWLFLTPGAWTWIEKDLEVPELLLQELLLQTSQQLFPTLWVGGLRRCLARLNAPIRAFPSACAAPHPTRSWQAGCCLSLKAGPKSHNPLEQVPDTSGSLGSLKRHVGTCLAVGPS